MVKVVHSLLWDLGSTLRSHSFFKFVFIKPWRQQVTRKPLGLTDQMEMEKGPTCTHDTQAVGSHRSDGEGSTSDTQAIGTHRSDGDGERSYRYT